MTTNHKPGKRLCTILADLLQCAEANPGQPVQTRLTNNLRIDIKVAGTIVMLLISRSDVFPSDCEWRTVLRHWPYPVQAVPTKIDQPTRKYLKAFWPIQTRFTVLQEAQSPASEKQPG